MRYWPNPAHKKETSEAGPPRWRPKKTLCPRMEPDERERLLQEAVPENPGVVGSSRYALRLGEGGYEWFVALLTRMVDGEPEYHGFPCAHVPYRVLRAFRDAGRITDAEYRRFIKELR